MPRPLSEGNPPVTEPKLPTDLNPAICRAGYLQFSGNRSFTNSHVQSRAFFWCKSGKGKFIVNGETYTLAPRDLYLLPWNRTIKYVPDPNDPMYTGHVHLIPNYRKGAEWIPNVPHSKGDVAYNSKDRGDANWKGLEGVVAFKINATDNIALLLDYAIHCHLRERGSNEQEARNLGELLVRELLFLQASSKIPNHNYPEELVRLIAHIESSYMRSVTVAELAKIIGRSRSHVLKLFRTHIGISAKNYIIDKRLNEACELLLSTTKSIAEIGQAVGISDPYHFSKLFRHHIKHTPTSFRSNHGMIMVESDRG